MLKVDIESTVRSLLDIAIPDWDANKVLHIPISICVSDYQDGEYKSASANVHFLILRRSNYKTVWSAVHLDSEERKNFRLGNDWGRHISHHDSCWINSISDVANKVCFHLCDSVNPNKPPRELDQHSSIGTLLYKPRVYVCDPRTEIVRNNSFQNVNYYVENIRSAT